MTNGDEPSGPGQARPNDDSPPTPGDASDLVGYLVAHRDHYTRDALTDRLIESGFPSEAIATAWVRADERAAADSAADSAAEAQPRARQTVLVLLAGLFAIAAFAIGEWGIIAGSSGRPLMALYAVLFPIQIALVTWWLVRRIETSSSLRAGDWFMTIGWLVIPPIAMLALIGICFGYSINFGCYIDCY